MRMKCIKCGIKRKSLADGICAYCDIDNWNKWVREQSKEERKEKK